MAHLDLSLLGSFLARLNGQQLGGFVSDKARALLAYLAVEIDRPHRREALATLLWPEDAESVARHSLSQALFNLRSILGDRDLSIGQPLAVPSRGHPTPEPFLLVTRETIRFNPGSDHHVDVTAFLSLCRACGEHAHRPGEECAACVHRLAEAAVLYRGTFLQDLAIADSVPYEEWATLQREQLHRFALDTLQRLAAAHQRHGDLERGLAHAWRLVALDPWREEGQRQLMSLLALSGQRSAALAQYESCRKALAEELGVEPENETVALYDAIREGTLVGAIGAGVRAPESPPCEPPVPDTRSLCVARERELAHLDAWLQEALAGHGRVGFVFGEPGSGKTVLLQEFARRAMDAHPDLVMAAGTCNAYAGPGDPYFPFLEILRLLTGDVEAQRAVGALSSEHARRLQGIAPAALQAVLQVGPALIDALLPGAALLERARALPDGATWAARVQEALSHRAGALSHTHLCDQATRVLQALAPDHPLLLILDDLQWSDTSSINLLFHLGRRLAGQRILVLGAYRPEEVAAGRDGQSHPLQAVFLELGASWEGSEIDLAQAEDRAFVEALVDSEPNRLGTAFREALYRHTGGHALFTVELMRGLQDRGDVARDEEGRWIDRPALDWGHLPKRVEAAIAARIARLSREEQELLAVASVEGEEFHAEVAARILKADTGGVLASLSGPLSREQRLLRAQSLHHLGEQRFSRYRFRHYLFQHYLYERLDPLRRAHLHGEVAGALEKLGAVASGAPDWAHTLEDVADNYDDLFHVPEGIVSEAQLAWHWEEAELVEKATVYHMRAGRRIILLSFAIEEALAHYVKTLELLARLPEGPRRARFERLAHGGVAYVLGHIKGWLAPEVGQALADCVTCAEKTGDRLLIAESLAGLATNRREHGELGLALSLHERALELAQGGPPGFVTWIQGELGRTFLLRGAFARALGLLAPLSDRLLRTGTILPLRNVAVHQLTHVPWALWCLGYPDQALAVGRAALQMILRDRDKFKAGQDILVLSAAICFTHRLRREVKGVSQGLQLLRSLAEEHPFLPYQLPGVTMYQGWIHTHSGHLDEGIAELRQALVARSRDSILLQPSTRGALAEALGRAGRADEGLAVLKEALEQVERTGERFAEAELHRIKGELLLQRGDDPEEAEACFRRAIEVAQKQEARSWELRATTSLARLLQAQGRTAEAREMLAAIYGWFTEGFDTPDLVEARELLEELAI